MTSAWNIPPLQYEQRLANRWLGRMLQGTTGLVPPSLPVFSKSHKFTVFGRFRRGDTFRHL